MRLYKEIKFDLRKFQTGGKATYWKNKIIFEGKEEEFNQYIEDWAFECGGLSEKQINYFLSSEPVLISEILGLEEEWDLIS